MHLDNSAVMHNHLWMVVGYVGPAGQVDDTAMHQAQRHSMHKSPSCIQCGICMKIVCKIQIPQDKGQREVDRAHVKYLQESSAKQT